MNRNNSYVLDREINRREFIVISSSLALAAVVTPPPSYSSEVPVNKMGITSNFSGIELAIVAANKKAS